MTKKYNFLQGIRDFLIITLVFALMPINSDLYLTSLPAITTDFIVNINYTQFTLSVFLIGLCPSLLIFGCLSDLFGRSRPLFWGLFINIIGNVCCWLAPNIYLLCLGRFIQGFGLGVTPGLARAMLRDLYEKEQLALYNSYLGLITVIIVSLTPLAGSYVQQYIGWRSNFLLLAVFTIIILYLFYKNIPETNPSLKNKNIVKTLRYTLLFLLRHFKILRFALCSLLTYGGIIAWYIEAPVVLQQQIGISSIKCGWLYIYPGIGFLLGGVLNVKLIYRLRIDSIIMLGLILQLISGCMLLCFFILKLMNVVTIVAPIVPFMIGASLIIPNCAVKVLTPFPHIAGAAGAIFEFSKILGGIFTSSAMAFLGDENLLPVAFIFILFSLFSIFICSVQEK
ncbi:multidrug effflux MFS transporter [Legionella clemsonensis]|uniref:Bcr/CflA family efflux transporter n=1 Tax=Legionella clemsonensis TaxID=1867846 RepID=A0A222P2W3_9GAMM|nr:multidrug effflux MFS transporter [Legionella clemsonensis]ASQ46198.1 Bicyclomycin resistance protein [Legionella clemsonensis]